MIRGLAGSGQVPGLRIATIMVPPLLADLIRHGLSSRVGPVTVTELADPQADSARLRQIGPDVVIVGPSTHAADATLIRTILPHAQVLMVSPDVSQLVDLGTGANEALTLAALADRLRR